ncbi:polysaccharide deacetylase [Gammaproteobacteria bacterium]|nr:polysaccharide deacetylase [Gammaproteobacteria bacterium]
MKYPYSPFPSRGKLTWPNNKRLAIIITINMETWDLIKDTDEAYYAGGPSILPDLLPGNVPDFPNYMWREYGQRVGVWRLLDVFDELSVKPECTVNAKTCIERHEMVKAAMDRKLQIIPHNYEQGELLTQYFNDPLKEEEVIKNTLDVYKETTSLIPQGWLSSSLRGTENTANILVKNGIRFYCDAMNDDQPYIIDTDSGPIVSIPYSNEINDFTLLTRRGHTTDEFRDILIEEMNVLYQESKATSKIMNIGLHPHVSGRAYRVRAIREFLEAAKELEGIWWATRSQIAEEYLKQSEEHI